MAERKNTIWRVVILALAVLFGCPQGEADAEPSVTKNSLKAAFIYHFISFTEWNDDKPSYFVCIPDDEDLREAARESFKGKMISNRRVVVVARTQSCHVLVSDRMAMMGDKALTIGQLGKGALFEFREIDHKMRFAVNLDLVQKSPFKISSQLLKLAIIDKDS